jgi:hypothetical protein
VIVVLRAEKRMTVPFVDVVRWVRGGTIAVEG